MKDQKTGPAVRDDEEGSRYVLPVNADRDAEAAIAAYEIDGGTITFTHTEVPESARGQGVASRLIEGALADVRHRGLHVVPVCSAFAGWMQRHPESHDLLAPEGRAMMTSRP